MNKYNIVKEVGSGSFGKALLCARKTDSAKCIIKQISIGKMDQKQLKLTELEATLLSKLRHPNIVNFWEYFRTSGYLYIVMEFADGGDLDTLIKNRKNNLFQEPKVSYLFILLFY